MSNEPEWRNPDDTFYGAWDRFTYAWYCLWQSVKMPIQRCFDWLNLHPKVQIAILVLLALITLLDLLVPHIRFS